MVVTVSSDDARSVKALALLAASDRWTKGHRKSDGRPFFVIHGSNGAVYWTDCRDCTCPDFARNAPQELGFACKHILAVRCWKLQRDGQAKQDRAKVQPKAKPAPTCRVCTGPLPKGVLSGVCSECQDADHVFEAVAAVKAAFGSTRDAIVQAIG